MEDSIVGMIIFGVISGLIVFGTFQFTFYAIFDMIRGRK